MLDYRIRNVIVLAATFLFLSAAILKKDSHRSVSDFSDTAQTGISDDLRYMERYPALPVHFSTLQDPLCKMQGKTNLHRITLFLQIPFLCYNFILSLLKYQFLFFPAGALYGNKYITSIMRLQTLQ
jgi:hypothetical protein